MKIDNLIEKIIEKINKPKSQFSFDAQRMFQEYLSDLKSIQSEQQEMIEAFKDLIYLNCTSCEIPTTPCKDYETRCSEFFIDKIKLLEKITGKPFGKE